MRITNKMITNNASGNINGNKVLVDKTNTQMTTQKKIARPSENPVIAIRSLRLQTTLNKVNQYYEKNIPDAESWMDVTETALTNIKDLLKNMRTLCVNGSTGTLTEDDRSTILTQLKSLQSQVYAEGNADYAGRTVFTGYRTDKTLTFTENDEKTSYLITEPYSADRIYKKSFYTNEVSVPPTADAVIDTTTLSNLKADQEVIKDDYYVIRMAYDNLDKVDSFEYTLSGGTTPVAQTLTVYEDEAAWAEASKAAGHDSKYVADDEIVMIKSTGEAVLGNTIANTFLSKDATFKINYEKTGFKNGELRPEYYFNCTQLTDENGAGVGEFDPATMTAADVLAGNGKGLVFERYDSNGEAVKYEIQYTVSQNQELTVNMEANECFNHDIYQDMGDMIDIVNRSISAHNKVDQIKNMMKSDEYADDNYQEALKSWLEVAQRECDYADDNLQKRYSELLGNVDSYLEDINLSITKMGCRGDQLAITKTRMNNQQQTVEELQSTNDDMDLSDIIIKYTAAYTAYQSSLTAAGKLGQQTLLNYI